LSSRHRVSGNLQALQVIILADELAVESRRKKKKSNCVAQYQSLSTKSLIEQFRVLSAVENSGAKQRRWKFWKSYLHEFAVVHSCRCWVTEVVTKEKKL
jgi:hypothetical protein